MIQKKSNKASTLQEKKKRPISVPSFLTGAPEAAVSWLPRDLSPLFNSGCKRRDSQSFWGFTMSFNSGAVCHIGLVFIIKCCWQHALQLMVIWVLSFDLNNPEAAFIISSFWEWRNEAQRVMLLFQGYRDGEKQGRWQLNFWHDSSLFSVYITIFSFSTPNNLFIFMMTLQPL